jgi:putative tricarboxylic transport membrane protein
MRLPLRARIAKVVPYAALLAGAAYLYVNAGAFHAAAKPGELGPDFWPRLLLALLMIVCAVAIARGLLFDAAPESASASAKERDGDATDAQEAAAPAARGLARLAAGIVLSAAYVASLEWLGFFVATALYLALFMILGRYRRWVVVASASLVGSLAFVFVFMKIVYVSLPLGTGPFQALSVALLALLGVR